MTTEQYDKIVTDRLVFGKPVKQIAEEIGRKDSAVFSVLSAFNAVKEQDWNRCEALTLNQGLPITLFTWAGERLGIQIPPSVEAAHKQRLAKSAQISREKYAEQKAGKAVPPEEAPHQDMKPADAKNSELFLLKLLEAVNQQNELLSQLMDAVIPKYVADMKDNVNANCDVLHGELKDINDTLGVVRNNTRKRGL